MRAVVAAIITLSVTTISLALNDATLSLRTYVLSFGINEGLFVALALSSSIVYKMMAIYRTKWGLIVLFILLLHIAPLSFQTLSSLAIKTVGVYVSNKSTVLVYDAKSYYNVTNLSISPSYINALEMLGDLKKFESSSVSFLSNEYVVTNVVRDGYVQNTRIIDGDTTDAFHHNETIATVSTSCVSSVFSDTLENYISPVSHYILNVYETECGIYIYDLHYTIADNSILLYSSFAVGIATNCSNITTAEFLFDVETCDSSIITAEADFIYTISTGYIVPVRVLNSTTTVNIPDLASLITNISISIEVSSLQINQRNVEYVEYITGVSDLFAGFDQGLFNNSLGNIVHARTVSSAAIALNTLWNLNSLNDAKNNADKVVHNIVQIAFFKRVYAYVFSMVIIWFTVIISFLGIIMTYLAPKNTIPNNELALMDNVDATVFEDRRDMLNDPVKQRAYAFNKTLHARSFDSLITYNETEAKEQHNALLEAAGESTSSIASL